MDAIKDFLKKNVKATMVVAMFGVAASLAFNADGCSVGVSPVMEAVQAP